MADILLVDLSRWMCKVGITLHRKVTKLHTGLHAQLAVPACKCDDLLEDGSLEVGNWHSRARANSF